jgi:hypothetical protein
MIFSCAVGFSKNILKIPDLSLPPCTVRNYVIPKGIMKTRFEPRPQGMSSSWV